MGLAELAPTETTELAKAAVAEQRRRDETHVAEIARLRQEDEGRENEQRLQEAARKADVERVAAEQRRREADRAHRSAVMKTAKEAILAIDIDGVSISEPAAKAIVLAIVAGQVPAVTLTF